MAERSFDYINIDSTSEVLVSGGDQVEQEVLDGGTRSKVNGIRKLMKESAETFKKAREASCLPGHACTVVVAKSLRGIPDDIQREAAGYLNSIVDATRMLVDDVKLSNTSRRMIIETIRFVRGRRIFCEKYFDHKKFEHIDEKFFRYVNWR